MNKKSHHRNIRIVGILFLSALVLGMYNNLALLAPVSNSSDFLTKMGTHSDTVIQSVLLSLATGIFSIFIALRLYEPFKKHSQILAMAYLAFCIIKFGFGIIDNAAVFALLSVSREFLQSATNDSSSYKMLGNVIAGARESTNLISILFGFINYFLFFYSAMRIKLLPLFFVIFGLLATSLGTLEILSNLFGIHHKWHIFMLLPLALCQFLFSIWLIIKGNNLPESEAEPI